MTECGYFEKAGRSPFMRLRNQMQASTFLVQTVLKRESSAFDSAVCAAAMQHLVLRHGMRCTRRRLGGAQDYQLRYPPTPLKTILLRTPCACVQRPSTILPHATHNNPDSHARTPRNQRQINALLVQTVLRFCRLAFDFAQTRLEQSPPLAHTTNCFTLVDST